MIIAEECGIIAIDALRIIGSHAVCDSAHNTGGVTVKILSTEKY